ncbi:MAG: glycosyltransferase [Glaciihabitans sp.]|nr:glycosyltransferase [Glaciihabitans sp.]
MATERPAAIRVASIPAGHPYIRHLLPVNDSATAGDSASVVYLADPLPDPAEPARWWPPVMLDAAWVRANADRFDVMHLHFGAESYSIAHLRELLDALEEVRRPFVYTVHDLANPQLADQAAHEAQLDLLVPRAAAVITLTEGAAAEINTRWNRRATVIGHPHLLPLDADFPEVAEITAGSPRVVGMHLRDLRPNIDAVRATATLLAAVTLLRTAGSNVIARIDVNASVRDTAVRDRVRELCAADPSAQLVEHPRYSDDELADSLAALDVAVLPYLHGTHSGWVELCFDLAVNVVGPRVGYAAEQHTDPGFFTPFDAGDAPSLARALAHALELANDGAPGQAPLVSPDRRSIQISRRAGRITQRNAIAAAHLAVYRAVREATPPALRIAVIAPLRYPIAEPHAGGLESSVWNQVLSLRQRGHEVVLCAPDGSDFLDTSPEQFVLPSLAWQPGEYATDSSYPAGYLDHALPALERALAFISDSPGRFDIVDNHSLNGEPLAWADRVGVPMISTLHTPTLPALLDAHDLTSSPRSHFLAVSEHTASEWAAEGIHSTVLPNAINTDRWSYGPGGDDLVWFGRIVPEKGAHLALEAARLAGMRIVLAGRVGDASYFAEEIEPLLGPTAEYIGPLDQSELTALVGRSACALVTPVWEEPFGLVIAEAMATGTPVAAFNSGGVAEVVGSSPGTALVAPGDAAALAAAVLGLVAATGADPTLRERIRASAVERFSLGTRARNLETIYRTLIANATSTSTATGTSTSPSASTADSRR